MRIFFLTLILTVLGWATLHAQHSISSAFQRTYTGDNITVEYNYQPGVRWRFGGGVKWLNSRRYNWNDERAFYQTRRARTWPQKFGLSGHVGFNPFPATWKIKPWLTWNTHFTYAGANFQWVERTGELINDELPVVIVHHEFLEAFPTIEQHLMLRLEAQFSQYVALQMGLGYGFGYSWGWDPSLEYFKWRHDHRIPVGNRKSYLEWAPIMSIGMTFSWGKP
ncbi:MAG: hypothetical protein R2787_11070 [Saprospiraceae bacterium]